MKSSSTKGLFSNIKLDLAAMLVGGSAFTNEVVADRLVSPGRVCRDCVYDMSREILLLIQIRFSSFSSVLGYVPVHPPLIVELTILS